VSSPPCKASSSSRGASSAPRLPGHLRTRPRRDRSGHPEPSLTVSPNRQSERSVRNDEPRRIRRETKNTPRHPQRAKASVAPRRAARRPRRSRKRPSRLEPAPDQHEARAPACTRASNKTGACGNRPCAPLGASGPLSLGAIKRGDWANPANNRPMWPKLNTASPKATVWARHCGPCLSRAPRPGMTTTRRSSPSKRERHGHGRSSMNARRRPSLPYREAAAFSGWRHSPPRRRRDQALPPRPPPPTARAADDRRPRPDPEICDDTLIAKPSVSDDCARHARRQVRGRLCANAEPSPWEWMLSASRPPRTSTFDVKIYARAPRHQNPDQGWRSSPGNAPAIELVRRRSPARRDRRQRTGGTKAQPSRDRLVVRKELKCARQRPAADVRSGDGDRNDALVDDEVRPADHSAALVTLATSVSGLHGTWTVGDRRAK